METVLISIGCTAISALVTYFITTISQKKYLKEVASEMISTHLQMHHGNKAVHDAVEEHARSCKAPSDIEKVKIGIAFLVGQNGGDPRQMGIL